MSIKKSVLVSSPDTIFQRDEVRQIAVNLPSGWCGTPHVFRNPHSAASKSGGARDAMMESKPSDCGDLLRFVLEQAFNETRVTPVSLIEQFLRQQRFLRAHETSFQPGL
jgi:hypothetical protein